MRYLVKYIVADIVASLVVVIDDVDVMSITILMHISLKSYPLIRLRLLKKIEILGRLNRLLKMKIC